MQIASLSDPRLIDMLQAGAVGVMPTDTIQGIVAKASDPVAVAKLYRIKHREGKPGTIIAANIGQLQSLGLTSEHLQHAASLWPNPVSVIIPASASLAYLHQDKGSLAVRIPSDAAIHQLLLYTGPLLTSSANMPGAAPATTTAEAEAYFGKQVDFYVDGKPSQSKPSTIVRFSEAGVIEVLREGALKLK